MRFTLGVNSQDRTSYRLRFEPIVSNHFGVRRNHRPPNLQGIREGQETG